MQIQVQSKPKESLNLNQERFCQLYATDREFFGNGVQSYIEVYEPDKSDKNWYKNACSSASQLLSNIKVYSRINELLDENGLNDSFVDKQLLYVVSQHADVTNKLGAIKEYNKLKQRITDKIQHEVLPTPILENLNVRNNNSHQENSGNEEAD